MTKPKFIALNLALLTISDSRTPATDKSGALLNERVQKAEHRCVRQQIVADNIYLIRATLSEWIADDEIHVIITTGGTGVTGRDGTPEAASVLFDKTMDGFGEVFRALSYQTIGTSTLQSRAIAGVANGTFVFCLPGSPGACADAWDQLIVKQLDSRTRPCNLTELIPRLKES